MENQLKQINGKAILSITHCRLPRIINLFTLLILSWLVFRGNYFNYNTNPNSFISREEIGKYFYCSIPAQRAAL